jgi:hypothetical protein
MMIAIESPYKRRTIMKTSAPIYLFLLAAAFMLFRSETYAASLRADPDFIATGFEWRGVPDVRLGDTIKFSSFSFGGMIDIRNEERFNQDLFPNHNWRGFVFAHYEYQLFSRDNNSGSLTGGFEHESAHPTMGFIEPTDDPHQMIYDNVYRNINLNSALLRYSHSYKKSYTLNFTCDLQFYFISRNTPELPYTDSGFSEGISGGAEILIPVSGSSEFFVSIFDRYIFRGDTESRRDVYFSEGGSVVQKNVLYPVINSVNTITMKTGITIHEAVPDGKVSLYYSILYGNISGLVDSRENRLQHAIGVEFFQ